MGKQEKSIAVVCMSIKSLVITSESMNPSNFKKEFSGSQKTDDPEEHHRNPTGKVGQKALAVVQDLSWGSFIPLLSIYFKFGRFFNLL